MASDGPTRSETGVPDAIASTQLARGSGGDEDAGPTDLLGTRVGRYVVLERLGQGGMGVVYAALDSALERKVALKLLPALAEDRRAHFEARLRREAQALARLEHPNVVGVYDVGVSETSVFVAMQLVDGATLADHVRDVKPAPRELLALFAAAGRGLAAAHEAGIVHRDVKPSNIFVDKDGAVFVGDFGLARGTDEADLPAATGSLLDEQMTRAGAVLGTPPYMSPEQHRGEPATPRSDQYSFCVSLWLMLFGEHPFAETWTQAAIAAANRDALREPTKRVPARVVRALRRGLRADPEARWPDMAHLVAEIAPRSRAPFLWGGAAAAAMVGVAVVTASLSSGPDPERSCTAAAHRLEAIWPANEQAVTDALTAAGLDPAKVTGPLDTYAKAWSDARRSTCSDDVTDQMRDHRARCLDDMLRVYDDVIGQLRAGAKPLLAHAVDVVAHLPSLEDCGFAAQAALPAPPASGLAEIADARLMLAQAQTQRYSDPAAAGRLVDRGLASARELAYPPLVAEAEFAVAERLWSEDDPRAGDAYTHAAELATSAHHDRIAAKAYAMALLEAAQRPDRPRIDLLMPIARAAANRVAEAEILARFEIAAAAAAHADNRTADAIALCREADAQSKKLTGVEHDEIEDEAAGCFATIYVGVDDTANAATWVDRWLAIAERRYGAGTLGTLQPVRKLAMVRFRQGKLDEAVATARRALQITERALGPDTIEILEDLSTLCQFLHQAGHRDEAIAVARRAVPIVEHAATAGTKSLRVAVTGEMTLAQLFRMLADNDAMYRHYAAALALGEQLPPDNPNIANVRFIVGQTFADAGDLARAAELVGRAHDTWARIHDPREFLAAAIQGEILASQQRCGDAVPVFEAAIAGMEKTRPERLNLVRAQLHLGTCLASTDAGRARATVEEAARDAAALGEGGQILAGEAKAWLAMHRVGPPARTGTTQWASTVRGVSSQYGETEWSAAQALGAPDTYPTSGDARTAWASMTEDDGTEWIEVGFGEPERARAIAIYETFHPGAVTLVEVITAAGKRTVYRGTAAAATEDARIQTVEFPCTAEPVLGVRVTLDSKAVAGWNEIDAIGAVGCK